MSLAVSSQPFFLLLIFSALNYCSKKLDNEVLIRLCTLWGKFILDLQSQLCLTDYGLARDLPVKLFHHETEAQILAAWLIQNDKWQLYCRIYFYSVCTHHSLY